jgi:hypothetical protein
MGLPKPTPLPGSGGTTASGTTKATASKTAAATKTAVTKASAKKAATKTTAKKAPTTRKGPSMPTATATDAALEKLFEDADALIGNRKAKAKADEARRKTGLKLITMVSEELGLDLVPKEDKEDKDSKSSKTKKAKTDKREFTLPKGVDYMVVPHLPKGVELRIASDSESATPYAVHQDSKFFYIKVDGVADRVVMVRPKYYSVHLSEMVALAVRAPRSSGSGRATETVKRVFLRPSKKDK